MRSVAHPLLSPVTLACWSAAAALTAVLWELPGHDFAGARGILGLIILLAGIGGAAAVCAAVKMSMRESAAKERDASQELLLEALLEECPTPDPDEPQVCRLRRDGDAA